MKGFDCHHLFFRIFWKPVLVEEQNKSSKKLWGHDIEKLEFLYSHKKKKRSKKANFFFHVSKSEVRHVVLTSSIDMRGCL